jgi:endoglycosylceramidase
MPQNGKDVQFRFQERTMMVTQSRFATPVTSACLVVLLLVTLIAVSHAAPAAGSGFVRADGRWFVDDEGRVLMLHGVNLLPPWPAKDEVITLGKSGFNSVRYVIRWDAIEPQPGQYDDAYLDKVAERLEWCREAGLRVILDMHQDLYAPKYGADGAPDWACLDDGQPHQPVPGAWFMTYFSPAVMRAFDNFYANKPGPGGVGIQDRYIAMWQHIANRFRDDPNVIGYDIMNEPSYGSALTAVMASIIAAAARDLGPESGAKLAGIFANPDNAFVIVSDAIQELTKKGSLFTVLDAAGGPAREFEKKTLQGFYDRIACAIREVDPNHIIVLETPMGDMSGTRMLSALQPPKGPDGKPLPNTVFSPHFYDFSSDFNFEYAGKVEYVRRFLARASASGDAMNVPTWFGEWGIWTNQAERPDGAVLAKHHVEALDQLLCGWAYWAYGSGFKNFAFLPALTEPYAQAIAGVPTRMQATADTFELEFKPMPSGGETIIWVPQNYKAETKVRFAGAGTARTSRDPDGRIRVTTSPGAGTCTVTIGLTRKQ